MIRRRSRWAALSTVVATVAMAFGSATPSVAQDAPRRVAVLVAVHHVSQRPGPVDPAAALLEQRLRSDFRFQSLRVLETKRLELDLGQVGEMTLPTGRVLRVNPRKVGSTGLLMRVEVEGLLRTTLRVPNHHQVVIGAERYEDGKLVVTLEPDY